MALIPPIVSPEVVQIALGAAFTGLGWWLRHRQDGALHPFRDALKKKLKEFEDAAAHGKLLDVLGVTPAPAPAPAPAEHPLLDELRPVLSALLQSKQAQEGLAKLAELLKAAPAPAPK